MRRSRTDKVQSLQTWTDPSTKRVYTVGMKVDDILTRKKETLVSIFSEPVPGTNQTEISFRVSSDWLEGYRNLSEICPSSQN